MVVLPNPATGANPALVNGSSPDAGTLTTRYAYDEVGNKIRQTDAEGRETRWEYDSMGREIARILPGGEREEKRYNAAGELIEHTDFRGRVTRYVYDLAGRVTQIDYPSDADHRFVYSAAGERIEAVDERGTSRSEFDARGRLIRLQDATGTITDQIDYDAFGNEIARSGSTAIEHLYRGEAFDPNVGFYYLRARWMDPRVGRFIGMDRFPMPDRYPIGQNRYVYADSNPTRFGDPSGHVTLGSLMSGISIAANLMLRAVAVYSFLDLATNEGVEFASALIAVVVGGPGGLASDSAPGIPSSGRIGEPTHNHHTIPEYLCGHGNQVLSAVPVSQHAALHLQLYSLRVKAAAGQRLVVERIMRRPTSRDNNRDRLILGATPAGRAILAESIQYVYEVGGWDGVGRLPIGTVFSREKGPYIRFKTSYPQCKKGATR